MTDKAKDKKTAGAAEKPAKAKYVEVVKDGETLKIHENQVDQHQRLGWTVKE